MFEIWKLGTETPLKFCSQEAWRPRLGNTAPPASRGLLQLCWALCCLLVTPTMSQGQGLWVSKLQSPAPVKMFQIQEIYTKYQQSKAGNSFLPSPHPSQLTVEMERALPALTPPSPLSCVRLSADAETYALTNYTFSIATSAFIALPGSPYLFLVFERRSGIGGLRVGSKNWPALGGVVLSL